MSQQVIPHKELPKNRSLSERRMSVIHDSLILLQTAGYGLRAATSPNRQKLVSNLARSASLFSVCNQGVTENRDEGLSFFIYF